MVQKSWARCADVEVAAATTTCRISDASRVRGSMRRSFVNARWGVRKQWYVLKDKGRKYYSLLCLRSLFVGISMLVL